MVRTTPTVFIQQHEAQLKDLFTSLYFVVHLYCTSPCTLYYTSPCSYFLHFPCTFRCWVISCFIGQGIRQVHQTEHVKMNRGKGHYKSQIRGAQDAVGTKLLDWAPLKWDSTLHAPGQFATLQLFLACVDRDSFPHCSVPKFLFYEAQMIYICGKHAPSIRPTYIMQLTLNSE